MLHIKDQLEVTKDDLVREFSVGAKSLSLDQITRQNLQCLLAEFDDRQEEYWSTLSQLNTIFQGAGVTLKTIKSLRSYPYIDSNVDIIVDKADWRMLSAEIQRKVWRKPTIGEFLEQTSIEPYKLKYQPLKKGLVAAHFYGGIRWRYCTPFNLKNFDPALLWREVPIPSSADTSATSIPTITVPTHELDIAIQCAHIATENYRITLGEIIHIDSVLNSPDFDHDVLQAISNDLGLSRCVKGICEIARAERDSSKAGELPAKPRQLSFLFMLRVHLDYGLNNGIFGLFRAMTSLLWFPVMRMGRLILGR